VYGLTRGLVRFHVRIEIREPEYELRTGVKGYPYLAGYDIDAADHGEAARLAVAAFKKDSAESGVGWRRVIQRLIVTRSNAVDQKAGDAKDFGTPDGLESLQTASVLSVDLPWSSRTTGRTAIAWWDGAAAHVLLEREERLVQRVQALAAPGALVLLDIPLDGCEHLGPADPFRQIDRSLQRAGIPILPSLKASGRGPTQRDALHAARRDLRIEESYPYAVLRVLWAMKQSGGPAALDGDSYAASRIEGDWRNWPPRYKRAGSVGARQDAMSQVADLLVWHDRRFASAVKAPPPDSAGSALARLSDEYDALLGLVAGVAAYEQSPWSWSAQCEGGAGRILSIADAWLRGRAGPRASQ
jgi:predicted nuclease with RNAse H fold